MKNLISLLLILLSICSFAQTTHYVASSSLYLKSDASSSSDLITTLDQYDNVKLLAEEEYWAKVEIDNHTGYVYKEHIEKGKAVFTYTSVRVGARCKDGSLSTDTGEDACSENGGINYWKTEERKSVKIVDN